jgi:hypothetical protein
VEPGFHLRYAGRLAWRYRLLFALGLAFLGLLHPGFALASPLALLLPARLFARRALREISRVSLAYATALAYGEERLWAEARRVRLELPPFPWGLFSPTSSSSFSSWPLPPGGREAGGWGLEPARGWSGPFVLPVSPPLGVRPLPRSRGGSQAREKRPPGPGGRPQRPSKGVLKAGG